MSGKGDSPRPYNPSVFGQNYDRIFGRTDPMHSITPGTIREYRTRCCLAKFETGNYPYDHWCGECGKTSDIVLTKVNP